MKVKVPRETGRLEMSPTSDKEKDVEMVLTDTADCLRRLKGTQCCDPVIDGLLGLAIAVIERMGGNIQQEYFCEDCGITGWVEHDKHADVMSVINRIQHDHKLRRPNCECGRIRVSNQVENGEAVDRAYVHGYEQATRDWRYCIHDAVATGGGTISEADLKRLAEVLDQVRSGRRKDKGGYE